MPFIDVKLSKKIDKAAESSLKAELGKFIEAFPGKSESWLMCCIDSDKNIWFKGTDTEDSAFIEVKLFGAVNSDSAEKFTSLVCEYLEVNLNIPASRVYIRYEGGTDWGWNGSNF